MNSKEYFNQVASQWDRMRESFFPEEIREKALAIAGVQGGQSAADIGAGSGFITEGLLVKGLEVVAIDQSAAMLEEMQSKFAGSSQIQYLLGEGQKLPLANQEVDYAFANMYLHHVESPLEAISEMARIVKTGGKVVITDLDQHNFTFLREEQHDRWLGFSREDIKKWFTEAGLTNIEVNCAGENCCSQSSCGCDQASISIFVACGVKGEPQ